MNRNSVDIEILEWMIGYYMILAFLLTSLVLPLVFLVPLFIFWRKTVYKKFNIMNLYADKMISKGTMRVKKLSISVVFLLVCIALIILVGLYKFYLEAGWLTKIAVPGATVVGDIFNAIFGFIGSVFSFLFSPMEHAYENACKVIFTYEMGLHDGGFALFWAQYVTVPVYKFLVGIGNFFCGIGDFIDKLYYLWLGKVGSIAIEHELGKTLSLMERVSKIFMG